MCIERTFAECPAGWSAMISMMQFGFDNNVDEMLNGMLDKCNLGKIQFEDTSSGNSCVIGSLFYPIYK